MYSIVKFDKEENSINDFLKLPKLLYSKKEIVQNESEERQLLLSTHILSGYFTLDKFLVYKDLDVVARCIITTYPNDEMAYIGFFECINDKKCASILFHEVRRFAAQNNYTKIVGPVDASFWLKYRLKINKFDERPYVSEPYNKDYYLDLFLDNKYRITERYVSNIYKKLPIFNFEKEKYKKRYKQFTSKGYKIISPKLKDYDKVISEIYKLLINLYKDFPIFKYLSMEDFVKQFQSHKHILDLSMVKMAYLNNQAVGFFIGMPDYNNSLYGKINLFTIVKVFFKKLRSKNYVMLYMGVSPEHLGLGAAITQTIIENIHKKSATSIGAFIKEGKITESYVKDVIESKYRYVLLEYNL